MQPQVTQRTNFILKLAKEIAREFGLGYVGTEHLLLAIVREGKGLGAQVLREYGIIEPTLRPEIEKLIQDKMQETWILGRLPGSPHFRDVFSRAAQEARGVGNWQICSIHLLMALLKEPNCIGYKALKQLGVSPEKVRAAMLQATKPAGTPSA